MPKKFKGENTKAQDARARKAAAKETAEEKRKQEEEDTAWRDDDKHVSKKQDRKVGHSGYTSFCSTSKADSSMQFVCSRIY